MGVLRQSCCWPSNKEKAKTLVQHLLANSMKNKLEEKALFQQSVSKTQFQMKTDVTGCASRHVPTRLLVAPEGGFLPTAGSIGLPAHHGKAPQHTAGA